MFNWIGRWWRKRQRSLDMSILWPACKSKASSLHQAQVAFAVHVFNDPAWTTDMSDEEINDFINTLK